MDITKVLATKYYDIYVKNREFIEANPNYQFIPPKGEIVTEDNTDDVKGQDNEQVGTEVREVVKLEEDTMPSKIIDISKEEKKD